jgi:hypothetical protein
VADRVRGTNGHAYCGISGRVTDRSLPLALRQVLCGPPRGSRDLVLVPLPLAFTIAYAVHSLAAGVAAIAGRCTPGRTPRLEAAWSVAKIVMIFLAA